MGIASRRAARGAAWRAEGTVRNDMIVYYRRTPHVRLCLTSMYTPHNHRTALLAPAYLLLRLLLLQTAAGWTRRSCCCAGAGVACAADQTRAPIEKMQKV